MKREDYIQAAKTIGIFLFACVAYCSIGILNTVVITGIWHVHWSIIIYSFFIECYSLEQGRIASVKEEPKLMAIITAINCVLLYLYW